MHERLAKALLDAEPVTACWDSTNEPVEFSQLVEYLNVGCKHVKQEENKLFCKYLDLGRGFESLYQIHRSKKEALGNWKTILEEYCHVSVNYVGRLRALYKLLKPYPKFKRLSISYYEMSKIKKTVQKMLEIEEYRNFWQQE